MGGFLSRCASLRKLDLTNTQLRAANGVALFRALNAPTALRALVLQNTGVSDAAIFHLCAASPHLPHLQ